MKAGRGKNKGNAFERRICQKLSLWWSEGKREDIFWRSASSGGVATMRSKRGKTMAGQSGDISAIHESGMPLTRLCTVELKRGYKGASIADMCDRLEASKPSKWEEFILQCQREAKESDSPFWILIVQRDRKRPMICIPTSFMNALLQIRKFSSFEFLCKIRIHRKNVRLNIVYLELDEFLQKVDHTIIEQLSKGLTNV